jgi:hypothetical protein
MLSLLVLEVIIALAVWLALRRRSWGVRLAVAATVLLLLAIATIGTLLLTGDRPAADSMTIRTDGM